MSPAHLQDLSFEVCESARPWLKSTQAVEQLLCAPIKIHPAIFFFQNRREARLRIVLRHCN